MDMHRSTCTVCGDGFEVRFRYQVEAAQGEFRYYCSQLCHERGVGGVGSPCCSVCGDAFVLEYPFQVTATAAGNLHYCSMSCRGNGAAKVAPEPVHTARRIAVFNHKGGTGKTTTAVSFAAGLAERGQRVLLIDADGQGNVAASLRIEAKHTLYDVLMRGVDVRTAAVTIRPNFDVIVSNELLAAAEIQLATRPNRERILKERLGEVASAYDTVVIDCAPALSLMNQNVLLFADSVVVPVSCDYLSLVGVRQVLRTLKQVRELLGHHVEVLGVVPTFYDMRNRISREAVSALLEHFGERCLPPIRINTKLREAPADGKTIFEHAPESHGARDYRLLVERVVGTASKDFEWTEDSEAHASPVMTFAKPVELSR
jgi:chromosome partitioning protein